MSDIDFYGLEAALVSLAMLVIAGGVFFVEAFLWHKRHKRSKSHAFALLPPLVYGLAAVAMMYLTEQGALSWKRALDDVAWLVAGLGLVVWVAVRIGIRDRGIRNDAQ